MRGFRRLSLNGPAASAFFHCPKKELVACNLIPELRTITFVGDGISKKKRANTLSGVRPYYPRGPAASMFLHCPKKDLVACKLILDVGTITFVRDGISK